MLEEHPLIEGAFNPQTVDTIGLLPWGTEDVHKLGISCNGISLTSEAIFVHKVAKEQLTILKDFINRACGCSVEELNQGDWVICTCREGERMPEDAKYVGMYDGYPVIAQGNVISLWIHGAVIKRQPPKENRDATGEES